MKKKLLFFLTLILVIFTSTSCLKQKEITEEVSSNPQQLQILKSDFKLTPEQVMSQIKAEHLIENKGYLDTDEVVIITKLQDTPLIDDFNNSTSSSIVDFANTMEGQAKLNRINHRQEKLINELFSKNLITSVEQQYSTIINAIAVKTTYGNIEKIEELSRVKSVSISETYNLPQSTDASAVENIVDIYETGIFKPTGVDYDGEGTAVAVLDSGFDCSHSVFATQPQTEMITKEKVSAFLTQMVEDANGKAAFAANAVKLTKAKEGKELTLTDVYYSRKIPYAYDYADKDYDVFPYDSEHGTHVAGIIGGKDDVITGIAINTQLVLMKVFPDLDDGGKTEDILAALEDAVLLGVDAINMSLGSSCGFSRMYDDDHVNEVYDKINESGISLIVAASNSFSSAFGGPQGNTAMATNPDTSTVGSPSTYEAALSVASISGVKSKYIVGNDSQVVFFKESNDITGEPNDFFKELNLPEEGFVEYEYVTVPGVGLRGSFEGLDLTGKIALVKRGDNTFEEKAMYAKAAGAVACIIYNNIEGDILMSMGKTEHIPTISISKDAGTILASRSTGKIRISYQNQAGPFMSDFSSWGPNPDLRLKPEITAHGGDIKSAVPGGGYDIQSGTSMATPNLCGIVILIRQHLKELYKDYTWKQISVLTNQLLMSTATIALNEEGNPYSPRKQGAGLASLQKAVTTKAYLTVDGIDRTKLELFDDPNRTGVYEMEFNVINLSSDTLTYDLSTIGMTESVGASDSKFISEKAQILKGNTTYEVVSEAGSLNNQTLTVNPNETVKLKVVYTLTDEDKTTIDTLFKYGMYVEGFVKLTAHNNEVDLNIPFLAFYGNWAEAPIFDKTYYEVESEAHNAAIDDEDKIKADYYATTPYGSYFYNYIIPLGTYLYDVDETKYDFIPASLDHIAISNTLATIDGISAVYGGMLRNSKTVYYSITDKVTGEVVWELTDYNAQKAHSLGGAPMPYYEYLKLSMQKLGLVNNREYEFSMKAYLDYERDNGEYTNARNSFEFDFLLDDEAPVLKDATYEKIYDKTEKKDRYYVTLTIYDNHYVQSITPIIFNSSSSYTFLTDNPIPVYSEKGVDNKVRFEITDYLEDIYNDAILTSALAFSIDDYALNSNIYLCQLPGTKGDFKFTKDGTMDGIDLVILSMYENEVVDLTEFLATSDKTVDADKSYLNHLVWTSSNTNVAEVKEGQVKCIKEGRATITVREAMNNKQAVLIINVKPQPKEEPNKKNRAVLEDVNDAKIESIRFSYFNTLFAYSRAAQTSEIGETGSRTFISSLSTISFYPGEKIQLFADFNPWYAEDLYETTFSSTNPSVASVDEDGVVTGLKKGSATITLKVAGSNLQARVRITIKSEFVIEDRTLVAYKGLGGDVVIPDDEGILYIGSYAFCLFDTDRTIELTEEDYDANKIPNANTSIKSVVIPDGVTEIQKYAFYNCSGLTSVTIPDTVKFIKEFAFAKDKSLTTINLDNIQVIGRDAFRNCEKLENITMNKLYAVGVSAFEGCTKLKSVDLRNLRNSGQRAFKDCTSLETVLLSKDTKLSYAMFVNAGMEEITISGIQIIPEFCFAKCANLKTVNYETRENAQSDAVIKKGAFSECTSLVEFNIKGELKELGEQLFYASSALKKFVMPNNDVTIGNYCFYKAESLEEVVFQENTKITKIDGSVFQDTSIETFTVHEKSPYYKGDGNYLLTKDGKTILFAALNKDYDTLIIDEKYEKIGDGAFAGANIKKVVFENPNIVIGDYAFAGCENLTTIEFKENANVEVGAYAFYQSKALEDVVNMASIKKTGEFAFRESAIKKVTIGSGATYGDGAFYNSKVVVATIQENAKLGVAAFCDCAYLVTVNMPELGNVSFGARCFARDFSLVTIDLSKTSSVIEEETFYGCTSLKAADLVNVVEIKKYAFSDCSALNYVNIPKVEIIEEGAFSRNTESAGAPQFSEITLPETLKELGEGVFIGCSGLASIVIPANIKEIPNYSFAYCLKLESVQLHTEVTKIGEFAFTACEMLRNINLENVTEVDDYAFTECVSLMRANLNKIERIGIGTFASCVSLSIVTGLENAQTIDKYAFQNASLFGIINLQKVETLEDGAFQNNENITKVILSSNISKIGDYTFDGCAKLEQFTTTTDELTKELNDYASISNGVLYTRLANGKLNLASVPGNYTVNGEVLSELVVVEGTYTISRYAGNRNKNITKVVLPDTLKRIGNYAFYQYDNLKTVEFKSIVAPLLEDSYNSNAVLDETDPGFDILHAHFDLFALELYYYTFIDLVGKNKPIEMVLPKNEDIFGYDSIVYLVYFGAVEDAKRSDYEAMQTSIFDFVDYAEKVKQITVVTLKHEELVNNAIFAYSNITQDYTKYGYSTEYIEELIQAVNDAKEIIRKTKVASSTQLTELENKIKNLPTTFDITKLELVKSINQEIAKLTRDQRQLIDLTNYNLLIASYNDYTQAIKQEATDATEAINYMFVYIGMIASTLTLAGVMYISSKRNYL